MFVSAAARCGTILVFAAIALSLPFPLPAQAQQEQQRDVSCREVRSLDALQYWFWDGYSGLVDVHDFTHERWGRLGVDPTICFRIALVVVEDPMQKAAGYRQAVGELIPWVAEDGRPEDDENAVLAARQLKRITGENFKTRAEWAEWWERSRDFVMWSEEEDRLVVVTEALESGEVVYDDALQLDAEEYWFYAARGWVSDSAPVGEFLFGSLRVPPHDFNFRVDAASLEDRVAKEQGYRRALASMFGDALESQQLDETSLAAVIEQLSRITGESFDGRDAWLSWWNTNRDRLVLSADGSRLVVGQ